MPTKKKFPSKEQILALIDKVNDDQDEKISKIKERDTGIMQKVIQKEESKRNKKEKKQRRLDSIKKRLVLQESKGDKASQQKGKGKNKKKNNKDTNNSDSEEDGKDHQRGKGRNSLADKHKKNKKVSFKI